MASTFSLELRDSFLIRAEDLKKIYSLLSDRIGKTQFTAECADNVSREFDDVSAITKYENAKAKRILNLDLSARSEDWKKTARISFTDKWYFGGIRVSIEARDDVVTRLRSDLLDVLSGMRPWYWPINRVDFSFLPLIIFLAVWLSVLADTAVRGSTEPASSTVQGSAVAQLTLIAFIAALVLIGYIAHRSRAAVFPHGTFLIGQEERRYDTLEKWRWGFVIAFFASLIAGVALLWFT